MKCHYETLGVGFTATSQEIRTAYRQLALKLHPDKNPNKPDAQENFQNLQLAYETLSNPTDRKWYDDHRDQILNPDEENDSEAGANLPNLWKYFSARYSDTFFDDFHSLFERLDSSSKYPKFNGENIVQFYSRWEGFSTDLSFVWEDKWKERVGGETRYVRRRVKQENEKIRAKKKKEWNLLVRKLVNYVKHLDPRWRKYVDDKQKKKEGQKKLQPQKKKTVNQDIEKRDYEEELEEIKKEGFFVLAEEEEVEDAPKETDVFQYGSYEKEEREEEPAKSKGDGGFCEVCNKTFKSDEGLNQHLRSKKHRQALKKQKKGIKPKKNANETVVSKPQKKQKGGKKKSEPVVLSCGICKETFDSRNKLFKHINELGHAELK
eukprot:augustus_masked-scaffold_2-processed-gene-22.37-mRNA-1 protein AED:0.25 eAED:0.26 QI:0/-1/0/1/-1/1/1/0/376